MCIPRKLFTTILKTLSHNSFALLKLRLSPVIKYNVAAMETQYHHLVNDSYSVRKWRGSLVPAQVMIHTVRGNDQTSIST